MSIKFKNKEHEKFYEQCLGRTGSLDPYHKAFFYTMGISGETRKHKEALKAAGCRWSSSKKLWSWHFAEDGSKWHRGKYSMAQIRNKYGSTTFSRDAAANDALPA